MNIFARLANPKKLTSAERDQIETILENRYNSGEMTDAEYRDLNRDLHGHA